MLFVLSFFSFLIIYFILNKLALQINLVDKPSIRKIHEGKIAIVIYHDENNDGKLNTGLFWRPKEGYAFSNKYIPKGPPRFKKAIIELIHGKPVTIKLNY